MRMLESPVSAKFSPISQLSAKFLVISQLNQSQVIFFPEFYILARSQSLKTP